MSSDINWKQHLKISTLTKIKGDTWKASEDIVLQSRGILQTFVWCGHELAPHHTNVCKILRLCGATPSLVFSKSLSH